MDPRSWQSVYIKLWKIALEDFSGKMLWKDALEECSIGEGEGDGGGKGEVNGATLARKIR